MSSKIYTKTGDKGQTGLIGGTRVPKHHLRIEAYGTIDELNSWLGMIRDHGITKEHTLVLLSIQDKLFTIGSALATDPQKKTAMKLPKIGEGDILFLEKEIDGMEANLPPLKNFILPGGHTVVSSVHIARCVCRRAERIVSQLSEQSAIDEIIIKYLNRLSDYLFVLTRAIGQKVNAIEIPWKPEV